MKKTPKNSDSDNRTRGRPKKEPISSLRTRAWFNAVALASGKSTYELDIEFAGVNRGSRKRYENRPCVWDKYARGDIEPRSKMGAKGQTPIVEKVERIYPGTVQWLTIPFWGVLGDEPMNMDELKEVYLSLSPGIRNLLIRKKRSRADPFWRIDITPDKLYDHLSEENSIEVGTVILAMVKEAEARQLEHQYYQALTVWKKCERKLSKDPVLSPLMDEIHARVALKAHRLSRELI
jgi:hypothetical protein